MSLIYWKKFYSRRRKENVGRNPAFFCVRISFKIYTIEKVNSYDLLRKSICEKMEECDIVNLYEKKYQ